ncbi:MAG: hypothetical protein J1E05_08700 [Eubacterium sp.]|nr:hypothetical protein [Eubacterium sp.]
MSKKLFKYEVAGFIFVGIFGTLNHFLFELFDSNVIIALFCPVNESVWEHLKLLFFPYFLWTGIEYFLLKDQRNYFCSKLKGVIFGMIFIVTFFYTYSGVSGNDNTFIDILSFFIGVAIAFIISYEFMRNGKSGSPLQENASLFIFIFISAVFFIFTFAPPLIPLFEDPQRFTYGI